MLPRLRRVAHALSRSGADADDLAAATLERAWKSRAQWQPGTRLDAWLFRILRNIAIDVGRARTRTDRWTAPEEAGLGVGHDPRPGVEARLTLDRVMAAMERLPAEQREAVTLVLIDGLGYREAAEVLGWPIGTLSSRLVRGRAALLALIGEEQCHDR